MLDSVRAAKRVIRGQIARVGYYLHSLQYTPDLLPSKSPEFGIRQGYRHRPDNSYFDDTTMPDNWQREVYAEAAAFAKSVGAHSVMDVGCGSALKLLEHFQHLHTIGLDIEPTLAFLRSRYPQRTWLESDFSTPSPEPVDVVICADVVEHIPDPDTLMDFLHRIPAQRWFVSTPERTIVYGWDHAGPPRNPCHCREWTLREFTQYASRWFNVVDAKITNRAQGTQMLVLERAD